MYYIAVNNKESICRIFNCLTTVTKYVKNNSSNWTFNKAICYKLQKAALAYVKANYKDYLVLGNNGDVIHTPLTYKSSVENAVEIMKEQGIFIPVPPVKSKVKEEPVVKDNVVDKVEPNSTTVTDGEKSNDENSIVESEDSLLEPITEVETTPDIDINSYILEFDEDYDSVVHKLKNGIITKGLGASVTSIVSDSLDTLIARRLDNYLCSNGLENTTGPEETNVVVPEKNVEISELPTFVTDINKQLITKLLHLDIFELQRVFSDFSTALVCADGSFKSGLMAYAYIMITGGKVIEEADLCCIEGKVLSKMDGTSTQAEFTSVKQAIAKAAALGVKDLIICYDCESIISTLSGFSVRTTEQQQFKSFVETMGSMVNLHFVKVKAHSGIPLHTRADVLAGIKVGRSI